MDILHPDIHRLRLACAVPNPEDGCSYHRALGPFGAMCREEPRLDVIGPQLSRTGRGGWDLGWNFIAGADVVFLERPFLPVHVQFCKQCKAMGLPLWVEWDDLLWDVPRSNPSREAYADQAAVRECMMEIVQLADVVTTATVPLAETLGPKARVIPNAQHTKFYSEPRSRKVFWRGSASHDADVAPVLRELAELSRLPQFASWKWHFSGGVPYVIHDAIPESALEISPGTGPIFFVPLMGLMAPWVLIVPLQNCFFNHCKSNLAWIEGTCAGAVVVAPDWEEWHRPGIINYRSPADFKEKLRQVIGEYKEGTFHPNVQLSRDYIENHLALPIVNRQRWQLLNQLYGYKETV